MLCVWRLLLLLSQLNFHQKKGLRGHEIVDIVGFYPFFSFYCFCKNLPLNLLSMSLSFSQDSPCFLLSSHIMLEDKCFYIFGVTFACYIMVAQWSSVGWALKTKGIRPNELHLKLSGLGIENQKVNTSLHLETKRRLQINKTFSRVREEWVD